jgi:hypothetical protein
MTSNFFSPENRAVYAMILKNNVEPGGHVTIWRMRTACWKPKATNKVCKSYCLHHRNNYTNAPQCYVTLTLPVLLFVLPSYLCYNAAENISFDYTIVRKVNFQLHYKGYGSNWPNPTVRTILRVSNENCRLFLLTSSSPLYGKRTQGFAAIVRYGTKSWNIKTFVPM